MMASLTGKKIKRVEKIAETSKNKKAGKTIKDRVRNKRKRKLESEDANKIAPVRKPIYPLNTSVTEVTGSSKSTDDWEPEGLSEACPEIPVHIIQNVVEKRNCGGLANDVLECLSDDCSEKLADVLSDGFRFMKRCNRQTFTVEDFKRGLTFYGLDKLLGW